MRTVHIILKNKLVALDSIMPLAYEIHLKSSQKIIFYTFDKAIKDALEYNIVLKDLILTMGGINYLGVSNSEYKFFKKIYSVYKLILLFTRLLFKKESVIHFGLLEKYPFRFLYLINRKKTFYSCKDVFGPFSDEAINVSIKQGAGKNYSIKMDDKCNSAAASRLISFSNDWEYLSCKNIKYKYIYEYPRRQKVWIDYAKSVCDRYFYKDINGENIDYSNGIITFILGHVGYPLPGDPMGNARNEAVYTILKTIYSLNLPYPVFIKPHILCDVGIVEDFIRQIYKDSPRNMHFTTLHPSVLAIKTKFAISVGGSTTLGDFYLSGIPTIDYSIMNKEELQITGGKSGNDRHVTYFINRDPMQDTDQKCAELELNHSIIEALNDKNRMQPYFSNDSNSDLLSYLLN